MRLSHTSLLVGLVFGLATFAQPVVAKKGGGKGGGGGGDSTPNLSCASQSSNFPAFAYVDTKLGRKSSSSKVYLSNADGDCAVLVHATSTEANDLSFALNGNDVVIAWIENIDTNYNSRSTLYRQDSIKVLRLSASNKELASLGFVETVLSSGDESLIYSGMDLSNDGDSVVYIFDDATDGSYIQSLHEMDISSCSSSCLSNAIYTVSNSHEVITSVSYNTAANRVFFTGSFGPNASSPYAGFNLISFVEDQSGVFSSTAVLAAENSGYFGNDYSARGVIVDVDAGTTDLGSGAVEAVSYRFYNVNTGRNEVHVIDADSCSTSSTGDCLANGESSIEVIIDDAQLPSLSSGSLLFSSSEDDNLYRYYFFSELLSPVGLGTQAAQ